MKVETKFNPGDYVWCMKNNKPYKYQIHHIEIEVHQNAGFREVYIELIKGCTSLDSDRICRMAAFECFSTKKQLLDSFLTEEDSDGKEAS